MYKNMLTRLLCRIEQRLAVSAVFYFSVNKLLMNKTVKLTYPFLFVGLTKEIIYYWSSVYQSSFVEQQFRSVIAIWAYVILLGLFSYILRFVDIGEH